jgi:hypothetical protein
MMNRRSFCAAAIGAASVSLISGKAMAQSGVAVEAELVRRLDE